MKRRDFIRLTGAFGLTAFVHDRVGGVRQLFAQVPGGVMDPVALPKFVTPLLVPPAMPRVTKLTVRGERTSTTTRSPYGSSASRFCRRDSRPRRSGDTDRIR